MAYAAYGSRAYKYGNSTRLYGTPSPAFTERLWAIEIDWDNDGYFNGFNEGTYCIGLDTDRGFHELFGESGSGYVDGFAPPAMGRCTLMLDNSTGRYNLWNADGSPSSDILPNRKIRIRTKYGSTDTTMEDVFTGYVVDISNNVENQTAKIVAYDGVDILQGRIARVAAQVTGLTPSEVISDTLFSIEWNDGYSTDITSGMDVFWSNDTAYRTLTQIAKKNSAIWFIAADGSVVMERIFAIPSTDTNTTYTADYFLKPIILSQPWDNLFTEYKYFHDELSVQASTAVYTKDTNIDMTVAGSATTTFDIAYTYSPPSGEFYIVTSPTLSSSDFVVNTSSDGTGSDITGSCTVVLSDYGTGTQVSISNANASLGYLIGLVINGTPVIFNQAEYNVDITNWGSVNTKSIGFKSLYGTDLMQAQAEAHAKWLGYPHVTKQVTVKLHNRDEQFLHDINDSLLLNITKPYLAPLAWSTSFSLYYNNFRISRIRHKWLSDNGQDVETEWTLRHCVMQNTESPLV